MRRSSLYLVPVIALLAVAAPTSVSASHYVADERPTTPLGEFREDVGSWLDPWLEVSGTTIADDHAPWVAISLYELLLGTRPERCYRDTYAAHWVIATDLRALGQAPDLEQQEAAFERVFESIGRAEALAELDAANCSAFGADEVEAPVETTLDTATTAGGAIGPARVVDIHAAATLRFTDEHGDPIEEVAVTPGETVLFRVQNTAGFDHSFYIGTDQELPDPGGTTDSGIATWDSGIRELQWQVPDHVSGVLFGCTVPGHFETMHGSFAIAPA